MVGYKSIIAYRTGLDIASPSRQEAETAYSLWRTAGWPKDRGPGKTVRDWLLLTTLQAARRHDRIMHLHCWRRRPPISS